MDSERIKSRIAGRAQAKTVIELLGDDIGDQHSMRAMIAELSALLLPPEPVKTAQKQQSFAMLEQTKMPFGLYEGQEFQDIGLAYLDWLCRSEEEFYRDLRAYLKHPENNRVD